MSSPLSSRKAFLAALVALAASLAHAQTGHAVLDLVALANAISSSSAKIKAYCQEQATRFIITEAVAVKATNDVAALMQRVAVLEGDTVSLPPPPATGIPWTDWNHEVSMTTPTMPDRHFTYNTDGTVTLTCFPDSPMIGAGTTNPRQLVSTWINNQPTLQAEGKLSFWRAFVTLMDPETTGENNWKMEWHTVTGAGAGQLSCAVGVHTDYPVSYTTPGTNPRWLFQVTGPPGVRSYYGPAIEVGRRYDLAVEIGWSSTNGHFLADIDGARVCTDLKPNLYAGDQPGFGVYNYRLAVPWTARSVFSQPRFGATRADVGL